MSFKKINILKPKNICFQTNYFDVCVNINCGITIIKPLGDTSIRTINLVKPGNFFSYSNDREFKMVTGNIEYMGDLSLYGSEGTWAVLYDSLYNEYHVIVYTSNYYNYEYLSNISWHDEGEGIKIANKIEINRLPITKNEAFGEYQTYRNDPIDYLFGVDTDFDIPLFVAVWCEDPKSLLIFVHDN